MARRSHYHYSKREREQKKRKKKEEKLARKHGLEPPSEDAREGAPADLEGTPEAEAGNSEEE